MSKAQEKKRNQLKQARLVIVAGMYKRGYSLRKIQSEVVKRLELSSYSLATVHKDVQTLLDEWRENRIEDMDAALTLELERIDETCRELWEQWEKSKTDYNKTQRKQKALPPVTTRRGRLQSGRIRQKGRKQRLSCSETRHISPKSGNNLKNGVSCLVFTLPKRKTSTETYLSPLC